jgi:hypothetical protein
MPATPMCCEWGRGMLRHVPRTGDAFASERRTDPWHRLTAAALACLLILAVYHLVHGVYYLALQDPARAIADFRNRRAENAYFLDRVSPQSQYLLFLSRTDRTAERLAVGADARSRHGDVYVSGLPPWTYPLQLAAYLTGNERVARVYLAALDLLALATIGWLAATVLESPRGPSAPCLGVLSILAIGAINSTMTQGQSGLLVVACLAIVFTALGRRPGLANNLAAGVALAFAMTKPSISLPFVIPLLFERRVLLLASCVTILALALLGSSWWLQLSPLVQLAQFDRASLEVVDAGANVVLHAAVLWLHSARMARDLLMAAGLAAAALASWQLRADRPALFGVLAVIARLCTYHRAYDDVLLAFLMIALARRAFSADRSRGWQLMWIVTGSSLWLPYSLYVATAPQVYQTACWIAAGTAIWWYAVKCERGESNPHSLSATGS